MAQKNKSFNKVEITELFKTEIMNVLKQKKISDDDFKIANYLVEQASFMTAVLKELQMKIDEIGAIENFKNGKQTMLRENPALKSYNVTVKNYNSIIKTIFDMLPKAGFYDPKDVELNSFIKVNKTK